MPKKQSSFISFITDTNNIDSGIIGKGMSEQDSIDDLLKQINNEYLLNLQSNDFIVVKRYNG